MERRFGYLPFIHATPETIYDALKELVESPELREQYGRIGYSYVKRFHDYPVVVEQLKAIYQRAIGNVSKAA
jgi:glycosyltransferase involved in cell wall biosynthesis